MEYIVIGAEESFFSSEWNKCLWIVFSLFKMMMHKFKMVFLPSKCYTMKKYEFIEKKNLFILIWKYS